MELKERLRLAAQLIEPGWRVADIGTDHAYLPVELVRRGAAQSAIACDIGAGPCEAARRTVAAAGLGARIAVRQGDGLTPLAPDEVDAAVIAGMGGKAIAGILARSLPLAKSLRRLVLQPMNAAALLRNWLLENGWEIVEEELALEDARLYEIIAVEPARAARPAPKPLLLEIGPLLWRQRHPLLKMHIERLLAREKRVLAGMEGSEAARRTGKYERAQEKCEQLEAYLKCL